MSADNKLMNDLNEFNLKYAKYIKCNGNKTISINCPATDLTCCSAVDGNLQLVLDSEKKINNDITAMNQIISKNKGKIVTPSDYNKNYNKIVGEDKEVKKIRSDIDNKLKELYKINNSHVNDNVLQYDSAIYNGILYTILATTVATTVIYLTFTKL
jgi:hypothetical protein